MFVVLFVSLFAALALFCLLFPSVWASVAGDELLEAHEAGLMLVSYRNPVRQTGPPACMAKLIMLRHKINQVNTRKRCSTRQASLTYHVSPARPTRNAPWRSGRQHAKQYR